MQPLLAAIQPLAVKHGVDVARQHLFNPVARFPGGAKLARQRFG